MRYFPVSAVALHLCVCVCLDSEISDNQLMEEFECDFKDLEAESWSSTVDKKFLKTLKKDDIKRQDVIYGKNTLKVISVTERLATIMLVTPRVFSFHRALPDGVSPCEDAENHV